MKSGSTWPFKPASFPYNTPEPWGHKDLDMTEQLTFSRSLFSGYIVACINNLRLRIAMYNCTV